MDRCSELPGNGTMAGGVQARCHAAPKQHAGGDASDLQHMLAAMPAAQRLVHKAPSDAVASTHMACVHSTAAVATFKMFEAFRSSMLCLIYRAVILVRRARRARCHPCILLGTVAAGAACVCPAAGCKAMMKPVDMLQLLAVVCAPGGVRRPCGGWLWGVQRGQCPGRANIGTAAEAKQRQRRDPSASVAQKQI